MSETFCCTGIKIPLIESLNKYNTKYPRNCRFCRFVYYVIWNFCLNIRCTEIEISMCRYRSLWYEYSAFFVSNFDRILIVHSACQLRLHKDKRFRIISNKLTLFLYEWFPFSSDADLSSLPVI